MIEYPMRFSWILLFLCFLVPSDAIAGGAYAYGPLKSVIGVERDYRIVGEEALHEVAVNFGLGYNEIELANQSVNPWVPGAGTGVVLPTRWVLPEASFEDGIVINLPEMRLYHFFKLFGRKLVSTYPIGIGREGMDTPAGVYRISSKVKDPTWYVPESIRSDNPDLPASVPPGEDNPLGAYAMRLSGTEYLLHGTNRPFGVGRRVSHGCIRMQQEDITHLFGLVDVGARVEIVYQPVKVGIIGRSVYVEVHDDYAGIYPDMFAYALERIEARGIKVEQIDAALLESAINENTGMPVMVAGDVDIPDAR